MSDTKPTKKPRTVAVRFTVDIEGGTFVRRLTPAEAKRIIADFDDGETDDGLVGIDFEEVLNTGDIRINDVEIVKKKRKKRPEVKS